MFNLALKPLFCQTCVMLSLRIFTNKPKSEQGFLFFFVGGNKIVNNFFYLPIVYMIYLMYICIRN